MRNPQWCIAQARGIGLACLPVEILLAVGCSYAYCTRGQSDFDIKRSRCISLILK
jgi:hypothetical protein